MELSLAIGIASSGLLSAALVSVAYLNFLFGRCCGTPADSGGVVATDALEPPPDPTTKAGLRRFSWAELDSATGSFDPASVIGEGGFSTVYLARLPSSTPAAVKLHRSSSCSERLRRGFLLELDALLRARHPHIVPLLGYCDEGDEAALVFDFVPNGSLHDKLHGMTVLPWARRMSIALQLAEAVDYLHDGCDPQIVHGDITAANVLLDGRLEPKLCDFGSARMGFSASARPPARLIVGSLGYADPHYLRTGILSKKSDVYSFGVLLLEMVTGIPAFRPEEGRLLEAEVAAPLLRLGGGSEEVGRMVDARLGGEYDEAEAVAVASLAVICVREQPSLRPSMGEVLQMLRREKCR